MADSRDRVDAAALAEIAAAARSCGSIPRDSPRAHQRRDQVAGDFQRIRLRLN